MDPICYSEKAAPNTEQEEERKKLKEVNKVWAATIKSLKALCDQGRCVDLPLCGRFSRIVSEQPKVCFVPHLDFVASASFSFPENDSNVSPFTKSKDRSFVTVSLSSIAAICKLDRESCGSMLKEIFVKFVSHFKVTFSFRSIMLARVGTLSWTSKSEIQWHILTANYNSRTSLTIKISILKMHVFNAEILSSQSNDAAQSWRQVPIEKRYHTKSDRQ